MPPLGTPLVAVNLKTYPGTEGKAALELARNLAAAAKGARATVALCPPTVVLASVAGATSLPVLAQHVDPYPPGRGTGRTTVEAIRAAGAGGTLLNHSERPMRLADLAAAVARCGEAGLATIVCADDVASAAATASLGPTMVAVEPPELIGGDVSVTTADPDIVRRAVEAVAAVDPAIPVLCGAGVKSGEDVAAALDLGARGVLVASGVVKAPDPAAALRDLLSGV